MTSNPSQFDSIKDRIFTTLRGSSQFQSVQTMFIEATGHNLNLSPLKENINPLKGIYRFPTEEQKFARKLGEIVKYRKLAICVLETDGGDANTKFLLSIIANQLSGYASEIACGEIISSGEH